MGGLFDPGRVPSARLRLKTRSMPDGAARHRLFRAIRQLGFARRSIEARSIAEREESRIFDEALRQEREIRRQIEIARAELRIRQQARYEAMTEAEKAVDRLEEQIVAWVTF